MTGFEPAASWSRTKRTTKLCHTPICGSKRKSHFITAKTICQVVFAKRHSLFCFLVQSVLKIGRNIDR